MDITINFSNGKTNKFSKIDSHVCFNNIPIIIGEFNPLDEQYMEIYNEIKNNNESEEYARIKAGLLYAPYCDVSYQSIIELEDMIVLYMLGKTPFPQRNTPLIININNNLVINEIYYLPKTFDEYINYNYNQLFTLLLLNN